MFLQNRRRGDVIVRPGTSLMRAAAPVVESLEKRILFGFWPNGPVDEVPVRNQPAPTCPPQGPLPSGSGSDAPAATSQKPVRYFDGLPIISGSDLTSNGFGMTWGHTRSWTGLNNGSLNGNGWAISELPYVVYVGGANGSDTAGTGTIGDGPDAERKNDESLSIVYGGASAYTFSITTSSSVYDVYPAWGPMRNTLVRASSNTVLRLTDELGNVTDFYDVERDSFGKPVGNSLANNFNSKYGRFKSWTSANGSTTVQATYESSGSSGYLDYVIRSDSLSNVKERFDYSYANVTNDLVTGTTPRLISSVSMDRSTNGGSTWSTVRSVSYTYYTGRLASGSSFIDDSNGRLGDLKLAEIKDASGNVIDTSYYRYYKFTGESYSRASEGPTNLAASTGGPSPLSTATYSSGTYSNLLIMSGLKSVTSGAAFSRLAASVSGYQTASDSTIEPYVNNYFEYERWADHESTNYSSYRFFRTSYRFGSRYRVTKEIAQGAGCSTCTGGQGTYTFAYEQNQEDDEVYYGYNVLDTNVWMSKTTEYLPDTTSSTLDDNDRNIVYTNELGQPMLEVLVDRKGTTTTSDDATFATYYRYDAQGRLILKANPSAVEAFSESNPFETKDTGATKYDLVGFSGTTATRLKNTEGLIERFYYYNGWQFTPPPALGTAMYTTKLNSVSGLTGNSSAIVFGASAPQGTQMAYVKALSSIKQTILEWPTGTNFTVKFSAAQRSTNTVAQQLRVRIDGVAISTFSSITGTFTDYETSAFSVSPSGAHVLEIVGLTDDESMAFVDNVRIIPVSSGVTAPDVLDAGFEQPDIGANWRWGFEPIGTDATSTTPGGVQGYFRYSSISQGDTLSSTNPEIVQERRNYIARTWNGITVYPVATDTVYRNADGTGAQTTAYSYTWQYGTNQIESMTVTRPIVSTSENGSGSANAETVFYDNFGRVIWTKDADGFINRTKYDLGTGGVIETIVDVNTATTPDEPSGWSTPSGGGLHLITDYDVDGLGRTTRAVDPKGNVTYTRYDDAAHEARVYRGWYQVNSTTWKTTGPVRIAREYRGGTAIDGNGTGQVYWEVLNVAIGSFSTSTPTGSETFGASDITSLTRSLTNRSGQIIESDSYFKIPTSYSQTTVQLGTESSNNSANGNFNVTLIDYDGRGRLKRVQTPTGTVTRYVNDARGQLTSTWIGIDDTPTTGYWSPGNNSGADMFEIASSVFDVNGNLTTTTQNPGVGAAARVTQMYYDWRNRLVATKQGVQTSESTSVNRPIIYLAYDNLNRVIAQTRYDGDSEDISVSGGVPVEPDSTLRRTKTTTEYDSRGRVFATHVLKVTQSDGTLPGRSLDTNYWYDGRGDVIKVSEPGGLVSKAIYDGANRLSKAYQTDGGGDAATGSSGTWSDARDVVNDVVLSQDAYTYDADGNIIFTIHKDRFDSATETGELGNPSSTGTVAKARVSYTESYYDAADRVTGAVNLGTNGGTVLSSRPDSTLPTRSDTKLVTSYEYDSAGRLWKVTDPRGIENRTAYDALGRTTQAIENYVDGTASNADDRTTEYTYNGSGSLLTLKAVLPSGNQTTTYSYGANTSRGDAINDKEILIGVAYPDVSTSTSDSESYTFNALGQRISVTDRNGTVHGYSYDVLGRRTSEAITSLASGVNGDERRIDFTYDSAGRPWQFTTYSSTAGGSTNMLSQVVRAYNGFGQLKQESQKEVIAGAGTAPKVQYVYTEGVDSASNPVNNSRLIKIIYPSGRVVHYEYGTGGSLNDKISRLAYIADDTSGSAGTHLEEYSYLGLSTVVKLAHPETGIDLTYTSGSDTITGSSGGDRYVGLDRFGRVIDQRWFNGSTDVDRFNYGYDRDGNRLYKENLLDSTKSELYAYDNLNRLTSMRRGTLNSSKDAISGSANRAQDWSLDALGNWTSVTTGSVTQTRSHNEQNQIASIGSTTLVYDNNGNMTTDENGNTLKYDAWNRLKEVYASAGNLLTRYRYDALGRRTAETTLAPLGGGEYTFTGTSSGDTFRVVVNSSNLDLYVNGSVVTTITGTELRLHFNGGGGSDTLNIEGGTVHILNDLNASGSNTSLNISGTGTLVQIASPIVHVAAISLADASTLKLQQGLKCVLIVAAGAGTFSVGSSAVIDLADNAIIRRSTSSANASDLAAIDALATSGFNASGTHWAGVGLTSSAARDSYNGMVGVGSVSDPTGNASTYFAALTGESVGTYDIIARFTFMGDSNLDAELSADDYSNLDYAVYTGNDNLWINGDFNYDNVANADDYAYIDQAFSLLSAGSLTGQLDPATRLLFYSSSWQVVEERLGGKLDTQQVWSPRYVDALVLRDRDTDNNGSLDQRHYVEQDANFNVTSIASTSGTVVERFAYDAYGTPTVLDANWSNDSDNLSDVGWIYLHQGGRYSTATELYSFRFRDYDSGLGRWIQQDPKGYVDGLNSYAFGGSPTTTVDPFGLQTLDEQYTDSLQEPWPPRYNPPQPVADAPSPVESGWEIAKNLYNWVVTDFDEGGGAVGTGMRTFIGPDSYYARLLKSQTSFQIQRKEAIERLKRMVEARARAAACQDFNDILGLAVTLPGADEDVSGQFLLGQYVLKMNLRAWVTGRAQNGAIEVTADVKINYEVTDLFDPLGSRDPNQFTNYIQWEESTSFDLSVKCCDDDAAGE